MSMPDYIYMRDDTDGGIELCDNVEGTGYTRTVLLEAKHKEELEQAREKTRQQCADAISNLVVSRMGLDFPENFISRADIDRTIRNSGLDKGEWV